MRWRLLACRIYLREGPSDCLFRLNCKIGAGASAKFRIRGKLANGKKYTEDITAQIVKDESISRIWARQFIKELEDQFRVNPAKQQITKQQIIELSLKFSVLTKFTAFVAVDQAEVVNTSGEVRQIVQPVHMPEQWEMQNQSGWGHSSPLLQLLLSRLAEPVMRSGRWCHGSRVPAG